jgi:RNA polymerase sigma-70 factor (ECF subfamily)
MIRANSNSMVTSLNSAVTDTELLSGLIAGEKTAFELLVRHYHQPMKQVAQAIIGEAQAEEAVQEAWISVIGNLREFQGRSSLKTWLFTIVANEAKSRLRKNRSGQGKRDISIDHQQGGGLLDNGRWKRDGHWMEAPGAWHDNSPETLLSHEDFRHCLDKTLAMLPEDQKAVLTLRDYQGLDLEEICNILGLTASNVRVLIHRARLKVYAMVERFEETGKC